MRTYIFTTFLLFITSVFFAQQKEFSINWEESVNVSTSDKTYYVPGFNNQYFSFSPVYGIKYSNRWEVKSGLSPSSVKFTPLVTNTISIQDLKDLPLDALPTSPQFDSRTSISRGKPNFEFSFSPVYYANNQVYKIERFRIEYADGRSSSNFISSIQAADNSVLSSGDIYKFSVDKTGIFKLDKRFLESLGMNVRSINPQNLKIYGNGGAMLPLRNKDNQFFDPQENAIRVVGEADGRFDDEDYILFYAEGSLGFNAESLTHINTYTDKSYYFITASGGAGLRVQEQQQSIEAAASVINTFDDYQFYEVNERNLLNLGRRWFGERFDVINEQNFEFNFPNRVVSEPIDIRLYVAAISESPTVFTASVNGNQFANLPLLAINESILARGTAYDSYRFPDANPRIQVNGDQLNVQINYLNNGNPSSTGFLDFIAIGAERKLQGTGEQFSFANNSVINAAGVGKYEIANAATISEVWEVTNKAAVTSVSNKEGLSIFSFKSRLGVSRKFVALDAQDFYVPQQVSQNALIQNQNIKGSVLAARSAIDYLMITSDLLRPQAERLANHNRNFRGLNVKVVSLEEIYNEFSSGNPDIGGIRNLIRYVYESESSPEERLKYVCLFGDTSFDYKDRISNNNNIVPTFNTYFSFSQSQSYMTDDYFGSLDPEEGIIENGSPVGNGGADRLDVAVGRILADTPQLANSVVDKIISYDSQTALGRWRNNFLLVSDDVDLPWEFEELESTIDALGDQIQIEKPFINVKKIHSDSYVQQASAGGNRYPEVNEDIVNELEAGVLVMAYLGHGGENTLASEFIFTRDNAKALNNPDRLPLIVTVTCEFTRFDNPNRTAAGEELFWNSQGGAVGLVATTREISVRLGVSFNQQLTSELFSFGTNEIKSVAENLRETKNQINDDNRRVIFFIGDPAMKLGFAKPDIRLTSINDTPLTQQIDTLKALSRVRMAGEIVDATGNRLSAYSGDLSATVYDKYVNRQTLGNDGTRNAAGELLILDFKSLGAVLYRGQASVQNGVFNFEFVVPKDASIPIGNGRVNFYSKRTGIFEDQAGEDQRILVGGLDEDAPEDNEGPLINLYMNDEGFVNGGITNTSPTLLVKLEDENGINTASGIGHDLIAIVDGDEENPIILNDFYESDIDNFNIGKALRKLRDLEPGMHVVTVIAWDTYNNSSTADLQFIVAGDDELKLDRVLNYPNPFVNYTEFWFNHNRPFEPLEVQVQIFTISGKVVKTIHQLVNTTGFLSREITWNGLDDFGQKIGKGVYVYKITVKSTLTNKKVEKIEKLVIL
ncbi:type IX secretion system sortase PorU [Leeuwenhoekiella sp. LLG6367-2.1]|uniref:type IX secretion system sortase PorU n=1 Tax=Leeuwenhoekiella sp. LLG6367-2.1 TaxID=3160833 RepID=UPI00386429BB